ncbi:MAG TPA: SCP2 sterol-binding domain-containing protein [Spirochaetota bacterium]|nr:SCP2 sterol-binding domain-containing protein [Spirochaetota bacterium]
MAQAVKYLSTEWRDEAEKRLKSELSPEKMNNITSSMSNIYQNCPDGKTRYLFFKFEDGNFAELAIGDGEPPAAEFRISGDYEVFAKISRAELGSQKALMTGKLKLKGNMIKALKLASVADRLNKVLSKIPAEY